MTYGVFGLGNRQYEHFCAVGQRLHGVMADLGASPLLDPGLGDDDDDIDDDFDEWTLALFAELDARGDLGAGAVGGAGGAAAIPSYAVETAPAGAAPADADAQRCRQGRGTAAHDPFLASVLEVRELHTALSTRSCVHVELDLAGSGIAYAPGDHVAIFPRNDDAVVAEAARLLGAEPDSCFTLGAAPSGPVPPFTGAAEGGLGRSASFWASAGTESDRVRRRTPGHWPWMPTGRAVSRWCGPHPNPS